MNRSGIVVGIKLEHISGSLSAGDLSYADSYWGMAPYKDADVITTLVTRLNKEILAPKTDYSAGDMNSFKIAGYYYNSPELIMEVTGFQVFEEEQLAVWFGEDFFDSNDDNNEGKHCINIYVKFKF